MGGLRSLLRKTYHAISEKYYARKLSKEIQKTTPEQWEKIVGTQAPTSEEKQEVEAWVDAWCDKNKGKK